MMTFLPFADFAESAKSLDLRRLQNQRTEARFVLEWLDDRGFDLAAYGAARMWSGHRDALAVYYNAMCAEYERRGFKNGPTLPREQVPKSVRMPPWLGDAQFHSAQRAVLLVKNPAHYGPLGWPEATQPAQFDEYLYPTQLEDGTWGLYPQSQYQKRTIVAICHASVGDSKRISADHSSNCGEKRRKQTHNCGSLDSVSAAPVPAAPVSDRAALEEEYLQLMKKKLPELAARYKWPIRRDHCFMRVALDNAFGSCWYEHLDRKKGPAIRQISDADLKAALAHGRAMAADDANGRVVAKLDNNSLCWRGKQPKLIRRGQP